MRVKLLTLLGGGLLLGITAWGAEPQVIDRVAIVVNQQMLTLSEVEEATSAAQAQSRLPQLTPEFRGRVVRQLVEELLLLDYAQANGIEVTDQEVEDRLGALEERNPQLLQSYSRVELQERIVKDLKRQRVLGREVDPKIRVEESMVQTACEQERAQSREVELGQILFRKDATQAQAQATQVQKRLEEGASFESLARLYSDDPAAQENGGRVGFFRRGQILPEIDQAAFALKVGEVSDLVQTQFGFHLLTVFSERFPEGSSCGTLTEDRRQALSDRAYQQERERLAREFLSKLRETAEVSVRL